MSPSAFIQLLNELRLGVTSPQTIQTLRDLGRKVQYDDGIEPTCLFPTRNQVLNENRKRLEKIDAPKTVYTGTDVSGRQVKEPHKIFHEDLNELHKFLDKAGSALEL